MVALLNNLMSNLNIAYRQRRIQTDLELETILEIILIGFDN